MSPETHELDVQFMRRAIRLAMNARGRVEPNPMVGCVIVKDGRIIGEGIHERWGGPHAEPAALAACTESPAGATAYVSLEPCCHTGKKTPPCVPGLISAKLARVVVGCHDPNPHVNGRGIEQLRESGIEVTAPLLEAPAKQLIAPFIARTRYQRPYVTLKWAQSANGYLALRSRAPIRITNPLSDRIIHQFRARCDAIAVGTNTVLNDDPLLTARGVDQPRRLLRVVLSNSLIIGEHNRLVQTARKHPLIVYCSASSATAQNDVVAMLRNAGADVVPLADHEGHFSFAEVLRDLHRRDVTHLLVEPGPTLARAMLARNQADRVWIFRSPRSIDGHAPLAAPDIDYPETDELALGDDRLSEYLNLQGDLFFSCDPSADFILALNELAARRSRMGGI